MQLHLYPTNTELTTAVCSDPPPSPPHTHAQICTIPDVIDVIAEQVLLFSSAYNFVFTSGGVGPTHDDVTINGQPLQRHSCSSSHHVSFKNSSRFLPILMSTFIFLMPCCSFSTSKPPSCCSSSQMSTSLTLSNLLAPPVLLTTP